MAVEQRQERATGRWRSRWCPAACGVTQRSSTGVSNAEEEDDMCEKRAWGYTSDPKGRGWLGKPATRIPTAGRGANTARKQHALGGAGWG